MNKLRLLENMNDDEEIVSSEFWLLDCFYMVLYEHETKEFYLPLVYAGYKLSMDHYKNMWLPLYQFFHKSYESISRLSKRQVFGIRGV